MNHKSPESNDLLGVCEPIVYGQNIQSEVHVSVSQGNNNDLIFLSAITKHELDLENNVRNGTSGKEHQIWAGVWSKLNTAGVECVIRINFGWININGPQLERAALTNFLSFILLLCHAVTSSLKATVVGTFISWKREVRLSQAWQYIWYIYCIYLLRYESIN